MIQRKFYLIFIIIIFFILLPMHAQKKSRGKLNGSVDVQSAYYFDDNQTSNNEQKGFAINTYLNLGYTYNNFNTAIQYEIYEPPLIGYSPLLKGNRLMIGYAEYLHSKFSFRLGNMYEQFGSGLILRTYEDRTLGFNNSLLGANIRYIPFKNFQIKIIAGVPRKFLKYDTSTYVYGTDISLSVLPLFGLNSKNSWHIGGSWVRKDNQMPEHFEKYPKSVDLYALRSNLNKGVVSLSAEYTTKSKSLVMTPEKGFENIRGNALLMNLGVNTANIGMALDFRRIENLQFNTDYSTNEEAVPLNFIPSLTKQHKYTLAALFPHRIKGAGEIGGQIEVFSTIFQNYQKINPIYLSINAAYYNSLKEKDNNIGYNFFKFGDKMLFQEFGVEAQTSFYENIEATLSFVHQKHEEFSRLDFGQMLISSQTIISDLMFPLSQRQSLRMELQHQWSSSKDDQRWVMGLLEYGFAPRLMIYGSLMSNYRTNDTESTLYYSVGTSYNIQRLRIALGINRVRSGYQCSGGVCRYVPEHSGATLYINYSF